MVENHTLLFTDIVDSTRISEQLGDARMSALWEEHDRVARSLLRRWRGREIDKSDGFLLLFADAGDAVDFALEYHDAIAKLSIPLRARAGVHVGPILKRANAEEDVARGAKPLEIDGLTKSLAARVMSISQGGQTLLTASAHEVLGRHDLRTDRKGVWRLKGIDAPIEIFEIARQGAKSLEPIDSDKAYRVARREGYWVPIREIAHSLPAERDAFIGRDASLRELERQLNADARLVSVLGIGGIGKTRLVQHFGWTRLGEFPGGVWFCDLTNARSADGIIQAVANGMNIRLGQADGAAQLGNAIAGRGRCLLLLDNFEQVSAFAEETLGKWLDWAVEARFIVTSRAVLGIPGEQAISLDVMDEREGYDLFVSRARAVVAQFQPTEQERRSLQDLVRMLDGLPLAIELAAARVAVLPVATLLGRMSDRFKVLVSRGGRRSRQATLRATFDWSWDLLNRSERSALAQLSVFEGSCSLEAAESILEIPADSAHASVVDVLQSLAEKSLIRVGPARRFSLLVSIREYAVEQLEHLATEGGSFTHDALRDRHSRFFASRGESAATADGCVDMDNVMAACRHAVARQEAQTAVGLLEAAWAALRLRGPFKTGVELSTLVRQMPLGSSADVARVDKIFGIALRAVGRLGEARLRLEAALSSSVDARRPDLERQILSHLGDLNRMTGQTQQAQSQLAKALELARRSEDRIVECEASNALGDLLENSGQLAEAFAYYEAAIHIARAMGDRRREGGSLGNLGLLCANLGRMREAREHYEASLQIAREVGDRQWEGNTLCNLGLLHQIQGRLTEARDTLEAALQVALEMGYARLAAVVTCNLGLVHEAMLEPARALDCYEKAAASAKAIGDRRSEGQFLIYLGLLHARERRHPTAATCLDESEALLKSVSDRLSLGLLQCARAEAEQLAGHPLEAWKRLQHAGSIAEEVGATPESELGLALAKVKLTVPNRQAEFGSPSPPNC